MATESTRGSVGTQVEKAGGPSAGGEQAGLEKLDNLGRSPELDEHGAADDGQATATVLDGLPTETWTVFNDLHLPGRRYADIDHVVVGPPGVYVIDSKNWSGSIAVRGDVLRQNGCSREGAVAGVADAAITIGQLTSVAPDLVQPVLCFVRDAPVTGSARSVMFCSTSNVIRLLKSRPARLTEEQVQDACRALETAFADTAMPVVEPPGGVETPIEVRPATHRSLFRRPRVVPPKPRRYRHRKSSRGDSAG